MKSKQEMGWRQQLILLGGTGLVLVVPLVVDIACYDPFRTPKSLLARVFWGLLAALWLARPSWDFWGWPGVMLIAAGAFSSLAAGANQGLWSLVPVALTVLGFMGLRQLEAPGRRLLLRGLIFSGILEAVLALGFYDPAARPKSFLFLEKAEGRYQILGTMGNPADVAVYLVVPTLLALMQALQGKRRVFWLLLSLLQAIAVVMSQTLSALAALSLGIMLVFALQMPKDKRWLVVAGLAGGLALVTVAMPPLRQRVVDAYLAVQQGSFLWVASGRGAAWWSAWRMWAAHPLLGVGFDQFAAHAFSFLSQRALAERGRVLGLETGFGEAHNEPLQYLAEVGLVGVALLASSIVLAIRRGSPVDKKPFLASPILAACTVLAMFQFPFHLAAPAAQWLVVLMLLLPPLGDRPAYRIGSWLGLGVLLVSLGASWWQWRAWRGIKAAEALVAAVRQAPGQLPGPTLAERAYSHLKPKLRFLPASVVVETVAGNLAREAGLWDETLAHFRQALSLAERPELHFNLGVTLFALGREEEGLRHLVRAVELNPAVLHTITDRMLAGKLRAELARSGYLATYPWVEQWLPR